MVRRHANLSMRAMHACGVRPVVRRRSPHRHVPTPALAAAALALAGCGPVNPSIAITTTEPAGYGTTMPSATHGSSVTSSPATSSRSETATPTSAAPQTDAARTTGPSAVVDLATVYTSIGEVVVAGSGMTVYEFDMDSPGTESAGCVDQCASLWPPVLTDSERPVIAGITADVGTIASGDRFQVTINGWPLYTYAGDQRPGQTTGHGIEGMWWAVTPTGERVPGASTPAPTPTPTSSDLEPAPASPSETPPSPSTPGSPAPTPAPTATGAGEPTASRAPSASPAQTAPLPKGVA